MRKSFSIMLTVLLACLCIGCARTAEPVPTPLTPAATADVIEPMPSAAPGASEPMPNNAVGATDGTLAGGALAGGMIAGFEEGKVVEQMDAPDVVKAVKAKYPDATIKSITYATHAGNQVYHVMLDGAADTPEIYVDANGQITPYVAGTDNAAGNAAETTPAA